VQVAGLRSYSPTLGRWTRRDPIGEWGGLALYAIAGNAPIGGVDVLGLLGRSTASRIVKHALAKMTANKGAGSLYFAGSDDCMERGLAQLSAGLLLNQLSAEALKLIFTAVGGPVSGVLKKIGLAGLEALISEIATGDGALDEEELVGKITSVLGTIAPDEAKLLLPIVRDFITRGMGEKIGGSGRVVSVKNKRPAPKAGAQIKCEFYVTATVTGKVLEKYHDFTVYGVCEMD
jgi:hypothetical protein